MATTTETTTTAAAAATTTTNTLPAPAVPPYPTGAPSDLAAGTGNSNADTSGLDEELPPAYTPAPDIQQGESTVQYGPQRPFQTAPRPVQHAPHSAASARPTRPHASSPPTPTQLLFRQIRDSSRSRPSSNWTSYPGARVTRSTSNQSASPPSPRAPPLPPRPATTNSASTPSPLSPVSDFAREFYAVGAADPQHQHTPSESSGSGSGPASESHAPTTSPTPGRPLLRDGKLLVYPKGFLCRKCTDFVFSLLCYRLRPAQAVTSATNTLTPHIPAKNAGPNTPNPSPDRSRTRTLPLQIHQHHQPSSARCQIYNLLERRALQPLLHQFRNRNRDPHPSPPAAATIPRLTRQHTSHTPSPS
ncbi:hypothetical protein C0992_008856, partial [Termitomyces sp. T32_za158]